MAFKHKRHDEREISAAAIARLRNTVSRHVRGGWQRAVFARPGADPDDARVVAGPADRPPSEAQVDVLLQHAEDAARAGLLKHTYVIDERRRVRVDARHGRGKVQTLDDETVSKMMGGKDRPLRPDVSAPLLRVIGIMNPDGSISAKNAKKYKQVNHFVQLCRPIWDAVDKARTVDADAPLRILDLACGNGYLTFVTAEALRLRGTPARIHGVDLRADLVKRCRQRAHTLQAEHVTFEQGGIADVPEPERILGGPPDLVVALHACDTATDEALALAIRAGAPAILVAPCCQHELATQLPRSVDDSTVPALVDHGLLRQEYAALLTDALRVETLQACGYTVDLLEFVHGSHTPKNLLIRAHRRLPGRPDPKRWELDRVRELCTPLHVAPRLLALLQTENFS